RARRIRTRPLKEELQLQEATVTVTLVRPNAKIDAPPVTEDIPVRRGSTVAELARTVNDGDAERSVVGAIVDGRLVSLKHELEGPARVQLLDLTHQEGHRICQRTAIFILAAA